MDEIEDFWPETPHNRRSTNRRQTRVCARCRLRKIKCDYKVPSCSQCESASAPCMGFNSTTGQECPRSVVAYLENRVAELELEIQKQQSITLMPSTQMQMPDTTPKIEPPRTMDIGLKLADALGHTAEPSNTGNPWALYSVFQQSSSLPLPIARQNSQRELHSHIMNAAPSDISKLPQAAAEYMLKNYTDIHLPQYPCVYEPDLIAAYEKCRNDPDSATPFESFMLHIALAISARTLTWKDDQNARIASSGFYARARKQLEFIGRGDDGLHRLQAALLLAHYGFCDPGMIDVFYCAGEAVRLCVHLGLHKDPPAESPLDSLELDVRRRLCWTALGMEMAVCSYLRLPLTLQGCTVEAAMPSALADSCITSQGLLEGPTKKASALHFWSFRMLETEVYRVLWLGARHGHDSFEKWVDDILTRLHAWHEKAQGFASEQKLTFRDVQLNFLRMRLHRPTPHNLSPSQDFRLEAVLATFRLSDDYLQQLQQGRLYYPWHAVHICFESAVVLADSAWQCAEHLSKHVRPEEMIKHMQNHLQILTKLDELWHGVRGCVSSLETLIKPVIARLELVSYGLLLNAVDNEMTRRLNSFLFPDRDDRKAIDHFNTYTDFDDTATVQEHLYLNNDLTDFSWDLDDVSLYQIFDMQANPLELSGLFDMGSNI